MASRGCSPHPPLPVTPGLLLCQPHGGGAAGQEHTVCGPLSGGPYHSDVIGRARLPHFG